MVSKPAAARVRRSPSAACLAPVAVLAALAMATGCATREQLSPSSSERVAVLTPADTVPVSSASVWLPPESSPGGRERTLRALRGDLADALVGQGVSACEEEGAAPQEAQTERMPDPAAACAADVDAVVESELVAYGEVRRSWLWVLAAQAVVAGVGHGVAAAAITGSPQAGWVVGGTELVLELATWVGGTLVASRVIDPVLVRVRLFDCHAGRERDRWMLEGTRPVSHWLKREGEPPRSERLRAVADGVLYKAAKKIARSGARRASAGAQGG